MDQIINSSVIGARGYGIELVQHREGPGVGRPIAHRNGEILESDAETIRAEVRGALDAIKGEPGEKIRETVRAVAAEIKRKRAGEWDEDVRRFIAWTKVDA